MSSETFQETIERARRAATRISQELLIISLLDKHNTQAPANLEAVYSAWNSLGHELSTVQEQADRLWNSEEDNEAALAELRAKLQGPVVAVRSMFSEVPESPLAPKKFWGVQHLHLDHEPIVWGTALETAKEATQSCAEYGCFIVYGDDEEWVRVSK